MKALATNLCNNVLLRGKDDKIAITPMKLQKLMYYICRDIKKDQAGTEPIWKTGKEFHYRIWLMTGLDNDTNEGLGKVVSL